MSKYKQYDVFISHNSVDKPLVEILADKLREKNLHVWLDKEKLYAGGSLPESIRQAIINSRTALFCVSENGLGEWQKDEIEHCENWRIREGLTTIYVLLCNPEDLPYELNHILTSPRLYSRWDSIKPETTESLILSIFQGIKIWREKELERLLKKRDDARNRLLEVEQKIEEIEQEFFAEKDPHRQEVLSWLSDVQENADRYLKKELKKFPELESKINQDEGFQEFYYNLEAFIDLIELSFRARETSVLHDRNMIEASSKFHVLEFSSEEEHEVCKIYQHCLQSIAEFIPSPSTSTSECTNDKDNLKYYINHFCQQILPLIWI